MALKTILGIITGPITKIIDKAVTDKDLAQQIKQDILTQMLEYDSQVLSETASIIKAEAQSESFLTRAWRPIIMLWFAILLGLYWFGYAPDYLVENPDVVEQLFGLLKIGIGGYVVGRSVEKTAKTLSENGGVKEMLG